MAKNAKSSARPGEVIGDELEGHMSSVGRNNHHGAEAVEEKSESLKTGPTKCDHKNELIIGFKFQRF